MKLEEITDTKHSVPCPIKRAASECVVAGTTDVRSQRLERELAKTASRPPREECVALASLDTELSSSVPIPMGSYDEVSQDPHPTQRLGLTHACLER